MKKTCLDCNRPFKAAVDEQGRSRAVYCKRCKSEHKSAIRLAEIRHQNVEDPTIYIPRYNFRDIEEREVRGDEE
jgi:hypothetical protein